MPPSKFVDLNRETLGTEIVTIYVGPKRKSFSIHKKLLCSRSEYFDKAFNGGFKESDVTMYLPEDDPEAFDALVVYVYQNRLPNFPSERFSADCEGCDSYTDILNKLFYLATKCCMNVLANKIMDTLQDIHFKYGRIPSCSGIQEHYQNTSAASKIRLYCAATACYKLTYCTDEDMNEYKELARAEPDFGADCLAFQYQHGTRLVKHKSQMDPRKRLGGKAMSQCFFHTHTSGEVCHLETEAVKK
ncbi:hypothetical protein DL95DRAFT_500781 [Leptodontidium sp. 2 PMI_412]|nr:hypothetical protein DL95DRAFT_500781 [Leptodontidium sp. 2 PMI_412]